MRQTCFRFRHVLLPRSFAIEVDDANTWIYFWVLVHLCKHVDPRSGGVVLRAHHFHVCLPCGVPDSPRRRVVAAPFVPLSREMGQFPIRIRPGDLDGHDNEEEEEDVGPLVPPDCMCPEWPEYERIFWYGQPDIVEIVDFLRG